MGVDRTLMPAVGPDPTFLFPAIERHRLSNGLDVRVVSHGDLPILSLALTVPSGSSSDPAARHGLAGVVADMVDEGTGSLDAIQVSEALSAIGADYEVDVGADVTVFTLTTVARFSDKGARLLADMVTRPRLHEPDFARVRQLRRDRIRQSKDVPAAVAERAFLHVLYGEHSYGHTAIGDDGALESMSIAEVAEAHRSLYGPAGSTLVVTGGLPASELRAIGERGFGGWPMHRSSAPASATAPPGPAPSARRLVLAPRPTAQQSELRIGRLAAPRRTPDYFPLIVMNAVLGGQFVSRINMKLREEKGFTYGARTAFDWRRGVAPFALYTSVHTASTAEAVADALREFDALRGDRPVSASELELAKASLTRGYPQNFQTVSQVARAVGQMALYDLPPDYFTDFGPNVHAVTADDVTRVARAYLDPFALTVLVVGDPSVAAPLSALGLPPLETLPV